MLHFPVEAISAYVPLGVLYVLVALTLWTTLLRQSDAVSTGLWCGGAMLGGFGFAGLGIVGWQGDKYWLLASCVLVIASYVLRVNALRRDKKKKLGWLYELTFIWLVIMAYFLLSDFAFDSEAAFLVVHVFITGLLSYEALDTWKKYSYRNAAYISAAYGLLALLSLVRLMALWSIFWEHDPLTNGVPFYLDVLTLTGIVIASLYGSYGYMGLVLEKVHQQLIFQCKATYDQQLQSESERSKRSYAQALLKEKNQLTEMLVDEVRSPVSQTVPKLRHVQAYILQRERAVHEMAVELGQLNSSIKLLVRTVKSIDNYLMAVALMTNRRAPRKREVAIDSLIEISMADVWDEDRRRIDLTRKYASRTAYLDINLVCFAISNVAAYASKNHSASENIELQVSETDDPPLILVTTLFNPSQSSTSERGEEEHISEDVSVGLFVSQKIAEAHGGSLDFRMMEPQTQRYAITIKIPQDRE